MAEHGPQPLPSHCHRWVPGSLRRVASWRVGALWDPDSPTTAPSTQESQKIPCLHPESHLRSGPQSTLWSLSPWKSRVIQTLPSPGKASKSSILPVASQAFWPASIPGPVPVSFPVALSATRQVCWPSFSFSSSSYSLLPAGSEQAVAAGLQGRHSPPPFSGLLLFVLSVSL